MNHAYITAQIVRQPRFYYINQDKYFCTLLSIPNEKSNTFNILYAYGKIDNRFILDKVFYKDDFVVLEGSLYRKYFSKNIENTLVSNYSVKEMVYIKINKIQSY
uniref:Single-stranded DNA binding protein n=1 Tax=Crouania attenuata TaxID=42002 RepID=A0A4D6WVC1_9FLOR|nr:hypothetical protein [Crouania attenuata]